VNDSRGTDLSGDITGDNADWLSASLDEQPSIEMPAPALARPSSQPVDDHESDDHDTDDSETDDSESWERSVIGDEDLTDATIEPVVPKQSAAPATTTSTGSTEAPSKSSPQVRGKAQEAKVDPSPDKKRKPSTSEDASRSRQSAQLPTTGAPKATRSERRKARRADKRSAEREAKALMHRRPLWRGRIVPKTVLGISFTMLTTGLAMAASGTLLYMNYQYRQDQSDALVRNFPQQVRQAQRAVQNEGRNARSLIQDELEPLRKLAATAETLTTVLNAAEPSIWAVRTFDVDGQGTAGTAFVVASDDEKTFMVTSLSVVKASTARPGPQILVRKGTTESAATLWTWDDQSDLALLVVTGLGDQPPLSWAAPTATRLGDQVFIASGFGANDASIVEGRVGDVSADGVQHTAPIGTHFRGGPIIDAQGRVVAVASWDYAPLGFKSSGVFFAPPISAACDKVLRCVNNRVDGAGAQR
jgi:S1-C subfamily serine protease